MAVPGRPVAGALSVLTGGRDTPMMEKIDHDMSGHIYIHKMPLVVCLKVQTTK